MGGEEGAKEGKPGEEVTEVTCSAATSGNSYPIPWRYGSVIGVLNKIFVSEIVTMQ